MAGTLYGIGIGPGDPELLTLKAINILKSADIIYAPRSDTKKPSLAHSIIKTYVRDETVVEELLFPMIKDEEELLKHWTKAAKEVVASLKMLETVVFPTLGDPMFYSTFVYCADQVRRLLPEAHIQIIPGISSIFASAAAVNVPIALGDEKVAIIPCPKVMSVINRLRNEFDTIIIMKIGPKLSDLVDYLKHVGLGNSSYLVQRATLDDERIYSNCYDIPEEDIVNAGYLSIMIVRTDKN